jgi:hypothetical protein
MYTTLLGSALNQRDQAEGPPTTGRLLAELLRRRMQLTASGVPSPRQAKTVDDVASQLAYDLALISMVRSLGIVFVIERFDDGERHLLEQTLIDRGIPLDAIEERR